MSTNRDFIASLKPSPFSTKFASNTRIATSPKAFVATPATSATTSSGVRTQGVFGDLAAGAGAIVGAALGGPALIVGGAVIGYLVGSTAEIFLRYREMNLAEWDFANRVFKGTLPARMLKAVRSQSVVKSSAPKDRMSQFLDGLPDYCNMPQRVYLKSTCTPVFQFGRQTLSD